MGPKKDAKNIIE